MNRQTGKALIFDVETTGLPKRIPKSRRYFPYRMSSKFDSSRIVSIAWAITEVSEDPIGGYNLTPADLRQQYFIIKPESFSIPAESTAIHGITHDTAMSEGVDFHEAVQKLKDDLKDINIIVSHNLDFDLTILKSELARHEMDDVIAMFSSCEKVCTMMEGQRMMKVSKFPKLQELYTYFYPNKIMQNAHNALYDTLHCYECYKGLLTSENADGKKRSE
jgi:DNA polymerase III subunit epsilon